MTKRRRVIVKDKPAVRQTIVEGLPRSILRNLAKNI
jgi:hypothetical protein